MLRVKGGSRQSWVGLGIAVWVQIVSGNIFTFPLYSHLRSMDATHHRRVPGRTRTRHACGYNSGATRCPSPSSSPDTVEQIVLLRLLLVVPASASIAAQCRVRFLPRAGMSASSPSQAKEQDDDTKPLLTYVTKIKSVPGGGNYEIKYNICNFTFNGSYTRVRAHLLKMTGKGVRVCQKQEILIIGRHLPMLPTIRSVVTNLQKGVSIVSDGWSDPQRRSLINFMAVTESGPMFLKVIDCSNEIKDKDFIAKHMREVIMEVGHSNVVQIVTDNAAVCKAAGLIIEAEFPSIYWTPCVVHTLNLALKNICAAKNTEKNNVAYEECSWITQIADDAIFVKNFVMSHSMRLSIFNSFNSLKLLSIAPTKFASTIVMLKRFKQLKKGLQEMIISDQWSSYKEDDVAKAKFVKDTLLDDKWWDKVDYILSFTSPIYDVLRRTDTEASSLHLVYEMWDSMIEKVKNAIYQYERKEESERSTFYVVVHAILIDHWTKSSTPLHCLAHSLNPRYYSHEWLSEDSNRVPPHQDMELTRERLKCFKRFFLDVDVRRKVNIEFANFLDGREGFDDLDSLNDRGQMDPKAWWLVYDINAPILQKIALKLLAQPCSSSCCERNWSTYSFIHSLKRNKMTPHRAEDLVFVHSNLRLLSRNTPQYHQEETKMWDVAGDDFGSLDDCGILEIASLSLDEPELEGVFFNDDC
ncbi:hypothetical protein D0Y65_001409 [Glycine soja]|uniref:DUF659 domain-containing protein n=1 Tax=Glycine soja TaxID=3848 RepID=A0A445M2N6_GLYSO|nr:hypothetical protein D0Y65_001409 [Glycine soja]